MTEIRLKLNPKNTGHLLACYGVFEIAHQLKPDGSVMAHFCQEDTEFVIAKAERDLRGILTALRDAQLSVDKQTEAISLQLPGCSDPLVLNWWVADNSLKTWAGQQKIDKIVPLLTKALGDYPADRSPADIFNWGVSLRDDKGEATAATAFDTRLRRLTSIDIGFSMNDQGLKPTVYPAVEFFALVGIQRFRPIGDNTRKRCFTWSQPLPILIASLTDERLWFVERRAYSFSIQSRDEGKRYKALGQSQVIE
ncbi:MAG: hypothetical protein ACK4WM_10320 [Thermoflexales bacterium]